MGGLKSEFTRDVATLFSVSIRTISRIWHDAKLQLQHGSVVDVSSKRANVIRRKRIQIDFTHVSQIPLRRRTNIRSLAKAINVSKSTMHRRIKEGALRPHTNAIKPDLTDQNKKARLEFCLSMVTRSFSSASPTFYDMFNVIHIDEKWFYMSKPSKRYYLVPNEDEPLRTCKSKKFITKVMFLAAVARPRYNALGNEVF
ncbi:uncharacterized protein LOC110888087 [Helianthus annuus]|uniref:uncharacterized protein LOC110888087 n=1 Tax=Helianthus annuus TaxID=4232 RepID=UPI000B90369A|nr:uncharacterized protein LOC110888087 [Helianthus annuus]